MEFARLCCVFLVAVTSATAVPAGGRIVFPDEVKRQDKKLQEPITPPVLPIIPHLENDPSTLLPHENVNSRSAGPAKGSASDAIGVSPRLGFNNGFDVSPNSDGGLTASFSNGYSGFGNSHSAANSFSFGFNNGFQASQSASGASSFSNNGFGSSPFSGSQANSQSSSFSAGTNGISASAAAASAAASAYNGGAHSQSAGFGSSFGGNGVSASGSQSASSAFGSGNAFANALGTAIFGSQPTGNGNFGSRPSTSNFGEGELDIRHRGGFKGAATSIVFPDETSSGRRSDEPQVTSVSFGDNRWRAGSATYRTANDGDWLAILVSD